MAADPDLSTASTPSFRGINPDLRAPPAELAAYLDTSVPWTLVAERYDYRTQSGQLDGRTARNHALSSERRIRAMLEECSDDQLSTLMTDAGWTETPRSRSAAIDRLVTSLADVTSEIDADDTTASAPPATS
jgi:hypothetical protein